MICSNVISSAFEPAGSRSGNEAPIYSAAYLSELKAATPASRPRITADESMSYDEDVLLSVDPPASLAEVQEIVDLTGTQCCHIPERNQTKLYVRRYRHGYCHSIFFGYYCGEGETRSTSEDGGHYRRLHFALSN